MNPETQKIQPENTAARVALWRALHLEVDAPPPVIDDRIGLRLLAPDEDWHQRPDMHPEFSRLFRASIVARARFIDDLVIEQHALGVDQYVILGAGLDTFAQRKIEVASGMKIFEIDQPGPQEWKKRRLIELGFGVPEWLRFVPVDFEAGQSWWSQLIELGFDPAKPTVVSSTGVTLYLTREATVSTLKQLSKLAPGSTLAMTYILPKEFSDPEELPGREAAERGAKASGTPFTTFYTGDDMRAMAREAGFRKISTLPAAELAQRYFSGRTDGLRPGRSEELLVVGT